MTPLPDNLPWHTLSGAHAPYSTGNDQARRYALGFSPIVAFADARDPNFDALAPYCEAGEHLYCVDWSGTPPTGWRVDLDSAMYCMVWGADAPQADEAADATRLGAAHVPQALELTSLTRPGPFGPRTIELGDYFGYFEGERLVAMAGERMSAGTLREVSGVCTRPGFQGQGLARKLMLKLIRRQLLRGETPFLHVMCDNHNAIRLYERMGFAIQRRSVVRVISLG